MGTIVVGVDGSETAAAAARTAATLAAQRGATLHVVIAYDKAARPLAPSGPEDLGPKSALDLAEAVVAVVAADVRTIHPDVTSAALAGRPADVVCEEAGRVEAEVIVVGNKRVRGPSRVLGAVAHRVASHAPCDVYIAHTT